MLPWDVLLEAPKCINMLKEFPVFLTLSNSIFWKDDPDEEKGRGEKRNGKKEETEEPQEWSTQR